MKILLFLLIALNVSLAISEKVMIVGFENYQFSEPNVNFCILLKKSDDFKNYTSLEFNAEVTNNTSTYNFTMKCSLNASYENEENDLSYSCTNTSTSVQNIKSVKVVQNFFFYNETVNITLSAKDGIKLSSLANKTINNITTETGDLKYKSFTLKSIIFKDNEFIFNGKLNTSSTGESAILNLSGKNYTCTVSNTSIKLPVNPNSLIDDKLHGKMVDKTDGSKILIFNGDNVYDSVIYPREALNYDIELLGVGKYNLTTTNRNATGKVYFRGPSSSLSTLKNYLRFTATIKISNNSENFTVIGNKNIISENGIITYNISFPNTENKTIESITVQKDYVFSDDQTFPSADTDSPTIIYPSEIISDSDEFDIDYFKIFNMDFNEQAVYRNNFSFSFLLSDIKEIDNKTNAYLTYIPYNETSKENKKREEITNCKIYSLSIQNNYYKIKCNPKKSFITYINTIKFMVNSTNVTVRKLSSLQSSKNMTYAANANAIGNITYTYEETFLNRKLSSKGLSAGAIVAIVLATVAAILAVGLAFFFLSRRPPLPPNKNVVSNIQNSTTNIN